MTIRTFISAIFLFYSICAQAQVQDSAYVAQLKEEVGILKTTELIQSMSQRSEIMPSYHTELKALIAKQAYDFWVENEGEKYVSHKNVYAALYYANKYLNYDSTTFQSYNQVMAHSESVVSIKFGPDSSTFYSAGSDGRVLKWNLNDIKGIPTILYQGNHLIKSIDVSHDGEILMITSKSDGIFFVKTKDILSEGETISHDPELVQNATFFPNEYRYLTVNQSGQIRIKGFNVDSTLDRSNTQKINTIVIDESGKEVFLGGKQGQLEIINDRSDSSYFIPELFSINALAISQDKRMLAIGREKGDAVLYDLEKKEIIRIISGHQSAVTDVDFSSDNQHLLTASRDATTRIWDIDNSRVMPLILDDHEDWVFCAKFTPDGKRVITGSKDKHIRVWTIDFQELADRICDLVDRNLTSAEWEEYVGDTFSYQETCPIAQN